MLLGQALAVQEQVFGPVHPRVASALNEVGNVAMTRNRHEEARTAFRRMASIYEEVHAGKHYLIGIAKANLASAYMADKEYVRAVALFREALAMYAQTLPPGHLNVGITSIKLGRALLRQKKYEEAETATLTGYEILKKLTSPSLNFLQNSRSDLGEIYTALGQPEKAARYREELAAVAAKSQKP